MKSKRGGPKMSDPPAKKAKTTTRAQQSRDNKLDDPEFVLNNPNSPLFDDDIDLVVSLVPS